MLSSFMINSEALHNTIQVLLLSFSSTGKENSKQQPETHSLPAQQPQEKSSCLSIALVLKKNKINSHTDF